MIYFNLIIIQFQVRQWDLVMNQSNHQKTVVKFSRFNKDFWTMYPSFRESSTVSLVHSQSSLGRLKGANHILPKEAPISLLIYLKVMFNQGSWGDVTSPVSVLTLICNFKQDWFLQVKQFSLYSHTILLSFF